MLLDFEQVNRALTLVGLDKDIFRSVLKRGDKHAAITKNQKDHSDTISREAEPGALKGGKYWTRWSEAFNNQLNTLYGTLGIPLTYIIRELEILDGTTVYSTFVKECIARLPLLGIKY